MFDTSFPFPNMTTQIDFFQGLVANNIFAPKHVGSSVALVSPSGNDYSFYQERNGSIEVTSSTINTNHTHGARDGDRDARSPPPPLVSFSILANFSFIFVGITKVILRY